MYKRILLAYDGSLEGRTALREGALLARQCGAEVFLLSVLVDSGTLLLPEVALAGAFVHPEDDFMDILLLRGAFVPGERAPGSQAYGLRCMTDKTDCRGL
jgi:nucleotide-binding universal stress UspA family protein